MRPSLSCSTPERCSPPFRELLEEVARIHLADQRRLRPTPVDQAGEARAALEEVRRRLAGKTESELKMIADNIARREAPNPGVHVRTLYRICKGQHPEPWPEPPYSEAQVRL
jgi:hypothetical protein